MKSMDDRPVTKESIDANNINIDEVVARYTEILNQTTTHLENRIDTQDNVIAQLVAGYAELAANVEAILTVMASSDEEDRKALQQALAASKKQMLESLRSGKS